MEEALHCPYCQKEHTWSEMRTKGQPADVQGMLNFLKRQTGESFEDWNIREAYYFECACGRGFVVSEVPEACEVDETGDAAPAYMTIAIHEKPEKTERLLPLRIEKQTNREILITRDSLKLVQRKE